MESKTAEGKKRIKALNEEMVYNINQLFVKINGYSDELYEALFEGEEIDQLKKDFIKTIKNVKRDDFKMDS